MSTIWRIPLCDLEYDEAEEQAVLEVLRSKWLTMGPRTSEFEERFAAYLGVRHVVAVANCTAALELAFKIAFQNAPPKRRTIVLPTMTFVATVNAAVAAGLKPILIDSRDLDDPRMDPATALEACSEYGSGGLCIVHYAGVDAGAEELMNAAQAAGISLIEDAAHAIGGVTASGRKLGTLGRMGCFSFFSNKNLATGEGGALVTDDDDVARAARLLRSHGLTSGTSERHFVRVGGYDVLEFGHNYRWTEIGAALGVVQLEKLDQMNARRRNLLARYAKNLEGVTGVKILFAYQPVLSQSAAHLCVALFSTRALRDRVRDELHEHGVQTSHHYRPVHTFRAYREAIDSGTIVALPCPNAEKFSETALTLPLYPGLPESAVDEICDLIRRAMPGDGESS